MLSYLTNISNDTKGRSNTERSKKASTGEKTREGKGGEITVEIIW